MQDTRILVGVFVMLVLGLTWSGPALTHSPETSDKESMRSMKECLALPHSYKKMVCLEPHFRALTRTQTAEIALLKAKKFQRTDNIDDCHLIAHFIGEEVLNKHSADLGKALAECSMDCNQGCVHGAVQTYISEKSDTDNITADLISVCDTVSYDNRLRRQCIHGVGHGLLTGGLMPIAEAIESCHRFKGREISICLGGTFMENMQSHLLIPEAQLRAELPLICNEVAQMGNERYLRWCADHIGGGLMFYTGHDLEKSYRLCRLLPADQRPMCMVGIFGESKDVLENLR